VLTGLREEEKRKLKSGLCEEEMWKLQA